LLYVFCPAAARWWLVGADPVPPFDPVWKSLQDLASGETLHEYLIKYDFDGLIEEIRAYIREVEEYVTTPCPSPELMPIFRGGNLAGRRFGSQNAINPAAIEICSFTRAWPFFQDWRIGMQIERDSGYRLSSEKYI
jgi:hypothetical protein